MGPPVPCSLASGFYFAASRISSPAVLFCARNSFSHLCLLQLVSGSASIAFEREPESSDPRNCGIPVRCAPTDRALASALGQRTYSPLRRGFRSTVLRRMLHQRAMETLTCGNCFVARREIKWHVSLNGLSTHLCSRETRHQSHSQHQN